MIYVWKDKIVFPILLGDERIIKKEIKNLGFPLSDVKLRIQKQAKALKNMQKYFSETGEKKMQH